MSVFRSKKQIISEFRKIAEMEWVESVKKYGNDAGPGNTLEELLGIEENNLPIPNAGEWELKSQRKRSSSLVTMFHTEPSPRAARFVPRILLPKYGWEHKEAGKKYPDSEMSFRSTTYSHRYTDRGYRIVMNDAEKKVEFSFNSEEVSAHHRKWLQEIKMNVGNLDDLDPRPYWGYDDLYALARSKIHNTFFSPCHHKKLNGNEYFWYDEFYELSVFSKDRFLSCIRNGTIAIDFDARTGHNHGTKFRMKRNVFAELFKNVKRVVPESTDTLEKFL